MAACALADQLLVWSAVVPQSMGTNSRPLRIVPSALESQSYAQVVLHAARQLSELFEGASTIAYLLPKASVNAALL